MVSTRTEAEVTDGMELELLAESRRAFERAHPLRRVLNIYLDWLAATKELRITIVDCMHNEWYCDVVS